MIWRSKKIRAIASSYLLEIKLLLSHTLWLSLGENCSSDVILSRHGLRSFKSFFADLWSNIDHVATLEKIGYATFFKMSNLAYEKNSKAFSYSTIVKDEDSIFNLLTGQHLASPHLDMINCENSRRKLMRRAQRLSKYRGKKNFVFLYHHVVGQNTNWEVLYKKLDSYAARYRCNGRNCFMALFYYTKVDSPAKRGLTIKVINENLIRYEISTSEPWQFEYYGAEHDDDLIEQMFAHIKSKTVSHALARRIIMNNPSLGARIKEI